MRARLSTLALLAILAALGTACSLVVSTNGLTGGQEAAGGGGEPQQAPDGGSSSPGVELSDGGPLAVVNVDGGASPGATGDASFGSPGSGSLPDAGTIGQGLDDSGAPTHADAAAGRRLWIPFSHEGFPG